MMTAGEYYVGDLCYVMHDEWIEVCRLTSGGMGSLDGEFNLSDGRRFACYSTMYGDGTYYDDEGREYPVDAGLIGCIKLSDLNLENPSNKIEHGNVVHFVDDFETGSELGVIHFDEITIDTGDGEYDDEFDEDDEND
jgi:hypothetical protein